MTASIRANTRRAAAARFHFAQLAHGLAHEVMALRYVENGLNDAMSIAEVRRMIDRMIRERQQKIELVGGEGGNA